MKVRELNIVRFAPKIEGGFFTTVIHKVNAYFDANKISPYANTQMWIKTAVMLMLYIIPYTLMITGLGAGNPWLFYGFWFLLGCGMIGIGACVMHDANHGTYSRHKKVNSFIGFILEIIGGYTVTWKIQHNVLHHTYTNIAGLDEDIDSIILLRFSPRQKRYWFHRYQFVYAWFFYMIMTLYWMTAKDYIQAVRYRQHNLLVKQHVSLRQAILRITLYKIFYYAYIMVLPMMFSGMAWYHVLLGFVVMHCTAGLILSCIFQPSHIMETSGFSSPVTTDGKSRMEDAWAEHEVANTCNFSPRSKIMSWLIGGLNYQIEHHLFAGVCHVHYPKIAPIVKSTALEFGLPYNEQPTFLKALLEHTRMLKKLGEE